MKNTFSIFNLVNVNSYIYIFKFQVVYISMQSIFNKHELIMNNIEWIII